MHWCVFLALLAGCVPPSEAPLPASVPPSTDAAPSLDRLDRLVHTAANAVRRAEGIATVVWSDALAEIAEGHSRDMAERSFFAHVTPEGVSAQDRARAGGVDCRVHVGGGRTLVGVSENLYVSTRYQRVRTQTVGTRVTRTVDWISPENLARQTVQSWLDSPGHRRNLLKTTVSAHGIGVATDDADQAYITQVLC